MGKVGAVQTFDARHGHDAEERFGAEHAREDDRRQSDLCNERRDGERNAVVLGHARDRELGEQHDELVLDGRPQHVFRERAADADENEGGAHTAIKKRGAQGSTQRLS